MKNSIFILISIVFFASACKKKLDEFTQFNYPVTAAFPLPELDSLGQELTLESFEFESTIESELVKRNSAKNLIEDGKVNRLNLRMIYPPNASFNSVESMKVYLKTDALGELFVASRTNIPDTIGKLLEMNLEPVNIKPYLQSEKFKIVVRPVLRKKIENGTLLMVDCEFWINARILNN